MANNLTVDTITGGGPTLATDDVSSVHYPVNKLAFGADNTATWVSSTDGLPVEVLSNPFQTIDVAVGAADIGVGLLAKHKEDQVHLSSADGDYDILTLDSLGSLHVNAEAHHVFDGMNSASGWTVLGNDAANLATTKKHATGTDALTFDKVNGAANTTIAGIQKTLSSVDLGAVSPHDLLQTAFYIPDLTDVSYIFLRLGTDNTNYNEWRISDTSLTAATFEVASFVVGDPNYTGITGNGWNPAAVTWMAVGVGFDAETNTLSGIIFDEVSYHTNQHTSASLNAEVSSSVSSPNVKLNGFGGSTDTGNGVSGNGTLRVTVASDSTGVLSVDDNAGSLTVDNDGTFAVQAAQSGTWTVDLGTTDNAVLDSIAAAVKNETGAVTDGIMIQGDDGTDRKNINVDPTTGDVQVDVTNTVTVTGTVTTDAGTGVATSANQTTIIGHVDGIEGLLTTMDADTSTIAGAVSGTEMQVDVVAALPAGTNNIGDVDIATITAGSNLIGDVGLSGARISGGTTPFRDIDADEAAIEISDTQAQLYWVHCMNLTAAVLYLHFYNVADTGVTVGTTTPTLTFAIPTQGDTNGAGFALSVPNGIAFGTALSAAVTTTVGGSAGPAANGCILNVGYAN